MAEKLLSKLSQDFLEILNDEEYYDITIEVGNDPNVKVFRAHMNILNYRSPYLRRILSTNKKKNDGTLLNIKLSNVLPEIFDVILKYIYGGKVPLEEYETSNIVKIIETSIEFGLQELIDYLQSFLIENKAKWMEQNFILVYQTSFKHDSFSELQKFCTELIGDKPEKIFNSHDFTSISEQSLVSVIQNDNLQMSEVQIWEYVLKWGLAQNPELPSDPTTFSKDDFNVLKNTLQQCIPFIRFYNLTSKEFLDKVLPYKTVLPKELYKDLLKTFLSLSDPDSTPSDKSKPRVSRSELRNIDSKIITFQHAELISKWINRLEITDKLKNSHKFKLLYRGSRDGATRKKLHEICDGQSRTVSIVKVKGSNEILGGYNPTELKSDNSWSNTKDSFIFSFKSNDGIENHILSRVSNEKKAVFNGNNVGQSFGETDLDIWFENSCRSIRISYEKPIRKSEGNFSVEECEVFQVVFSVGECEVLYG